MFDIDIKRVSSSAYRSLQNLKEVATELREWCPSLECHVENGEMNWELNGIHLHMTLDDDFKNINDLLEVKLLVRS